MKDAISGAVAAVFGLSEEEQQSLIEALAKKAEVKAEVAIMKERLETIPKGGKQNNKERTRLDQEIKQLEKTEEYKAAVKMVRNLVKRQLEAIMEETVSNKSPQMRDALEQILNMVEEADVAKDFKYEAALHRLSCWSEEATRWQFKKRLENISEEDVIDWLDLERDLLSIEDQNSMLLWDILSKKFVMVWSAQVDRLEPETLLAGVRMASKAGLNPQEVLSGLSSLLRTPHELNVSIGVGGDSVIQVELPSQAAVGDLRRAVHAKCDWLPPVDLWPGPHTQVHMMQNVSDSWDPVGKMLSEAHASTPLSWLFLDEGATLVLVKVEHSFSVEKIPGERDCVCGHDLTTNDRYIVRCSCGGVHEYFFSPTPGDKMKDFDTCPLCGAKRVDVGA